MALVTGTAPTVLDNDKPLGQQINWADVAQKLQNAFDLASKRSNDRYCSIEIQAQSCIAMGGLAQALETIVKRQETELGRGTRIGNK